MSNFKRNGITTGKTRFTKAPVAPVEFSRMTDVFCHLTTFNAGDIVPICAMEVLPNDTFDLSLDSVVRQNTILTPTMGEMLLDVFAFFVPNRIINESWKNVQGENSSGRWVAPEVSLVPLVSSTPMVNQVQVPVGSIADYYGFPTQQPIPVSQLQQCHDLLFRGYLSIFNEKFRDQNYQPPIPFSKLNIDNDFFGVSGSALGIDVSADFKSPGDGSIGSGAIVKAIYGEGVEDLSLMQGISLPPARLVNYLSGVNRSVGFALSRPLKANKLHDYFTSVLPSPQKGPEVTFNISGVLPVDIETTDLADTSYGGMLRYKINSQDDTLQGGLNYSWLDEGTVRVLLDDKGITDSLGNDVGIVGDNLKRTVDLANAVGVSINELRTSAAVQQVYETLARGGSRYIEYISSMFGLETENPFSDIPVELGHSRVTLDLYQTAQTSASQDGSTPQGNLSAFGYTTKGGHLFTRTFLEHGYVHILAVVRHKNVYSSTMSRDKFRLNALDFYQPPLANISEQPVFAREINPFSANADGAFGYQEAWAEYRYEPDRVSGLMRTGVAGSLALWNYADEFSSTLRIADGNWLKSNSQEVLDRSLAVTSAVAPQFKGQFRFAVTKQRPMPVYSLPGMDII